MNRREFTASLAALAATPAIPLARVLPAAAATPAIPAGTYAWAQLIARAQNKCSPAMLARHINLDADVAATLFNDMVRDGVLRAPGVAGVSRAVSRIQTPGAHCTLGERTTFHAKRFLDTPTSSKDSRDAATPLVNTPKAGLGCIESAAEDEAHVSTDQHPKESPERG